MNNKYSLAWFQERAFDSLKELDNNVWDFSDSLLIYAPRNEDKYERIQQAESIYSQLVTRPERRYIESIAPDIAKLLPQEFDYIDLGPGTEHKEQFIFEAVKRPGKYFNYIPVDIDEKYLELAAGHAEQQGIPVVPIRSPFEELADRLPVSHMPRFVSIGLTYTNYAPSTILPLLKSIAGDNGHIFINSQIRERINMPEMVEVYSQEVYALMGPKIKLLGLDPVKDIAEHWCDDGIRAWFSLKNSNDRLSKMGIHPGSKILVYYFLRPSLESLQNDVSGSFHKYKLLDTGKTFVGSLLSTAPR